MKTKKTIISLLIGLVLLACAASGFLAVRVVTPTEADEGGDTLAIELIPYQQLFERNAALLGWDWQLLAAVCYEESHFNALALSSQGAQGLMQLMPVTAERFGLNDSTVWIPEENIRAATLYLATLQHTYSFISDSAQQACFVLASYNAGPAHIMDARRLAKRYGRSPYLWFDNTEYWLRLLQTDTYGTDSVTLYGTFANSEETISYVRKVLRTADRFRRLTN